MREEMAIVKELHDINRKLTAGIQVDTYGEMQVINRAANAITRLTDENAKLKREVDMAEKQSLDFYVEKENAAERQLKLISDQADVRRLTDERDSMREELEEAYINGIAYLGCYLIDNHESLFGGGETEIQNICVKASEKMYPQDKGSDV